MDSSKNTSETAMETYNLFSSGSSIQEIAELRDLAEGTICKHLESLIARGLVDLNELVNPNITEEVLSVVNENDPASLKEIKELLDPAFSYDEIRWVLADQRRLRKDIKKISDSNQANVEPLGTGAFTVRELTKYIKNKLEEDKKLNGLFVKGEVSNLTNHISGHIYFSLKDEKSQVRCIIFRRINSNLKFKIEDGMKIILKGDLEVYEPRGEYSIIVKEVQPDGLGALHLAYTQLKSKLEKEGLFSKEYKKQIPKFPKVVGVITSSSGAALQDILKVIKKRYPLVRIFVVPTLVQGRESASAIVESINLVNKLPKVDVIILGRGGGSLEDLWSFNEEIVARAIFKSQVPIISAVGHETDFTISDFVADERAPTPSAAAERIVPDIKEIYENIKHLGIRGAKSLYHQLKFYKSNLEQITSRPIFKRPTEKIIHSNYRELDQIAYQLKNSIIQILESRKKGLEIAESKITVLNPLSILERGYSIVMSDGKILTNFSDVKKGEDINIMLHRGKIDAKVKKTWKN